METESCTLKTLIEKEIGEAPFAANESRVTDPSRDVYGIALSGGGIRSSTFNLGLLQGLHHFRLLDQLDYLSTVSGGGYIGSFWTAWRSRPSQAPHRLDSGTQDSSTQGSGTRDPGTQDSGTHDSETHDSDLRDAGPHNAGTYDAGTYASSAEAPLAHPRTKPVFPDGTGSDGRPEPDPVRHLREFSNFLAPHLSILSWDTGRILVSLISSLVPSLLTALSIIALAVLTWCLTAYGLFALDPILSTSVYVAVTALVLVITEAVWRRRKEETDWWAYAEAVVWGLFTSGFVWWLLHVGLWGGGPGWYGPGQSLPVIGDAQTLDKWLYLLAPVAPWAAASLAMSIRRWWGSRWVRDHVQRVRRNSFDRVHARFILAGFIWTVIAALWWIGALLGGLATTGYQPGVTTGLVGSTGLAVWLFSRIQKRLSAEAKGSLGTGLLARLKPMLPKAMAYIAVILMIVATVAAIVAFERTDFTTNPAVTTAIASAVVVLLSLLLFNPNEIGLHTFYRARIARAYLGASNPDPKAARKTEEREDDDIQLTEIDAGTPFHLICCAANDLASRELGTLHRGACSAVLSRIGLTVAEKCRFWREELPAPTLSAAATASAAAFNPLMGGMSKELGPAVTFLMAAFNLRLGLWLPGVARTEPVTYLERRLIGLPFFKEMFGLAKAGGRHVHLSDGGHFENMAVYELIRRHARFIIASDCGMDPTVGFNDFGNVVRRVRADFGVDIQIDLSPLRPDADGMSRQAMVAGDIHYPEGDTGILLLFKPGTTGNEPADVAQYQTRNHQFPHESTGDQFYDEAQWEAYRRLGEHVAHDAFRNIITDLDAGTTTYISQVFLRARREGQAVPEGFGNRLSHFADRIAEIDALLRQPECTTLLREVYKEIDDLDRDRLMEADPSAFEPGESDERTEPRAQIADDASVEADEPVEHIELSAEPRRRRLPDPDDLAPSLHLIRRALLLLQEVYTSENLQEHHNHPLYLGLMNYFARWTSAPLFRLWWPLLKTMYPQPFTRFVERQYGIRASARRGESITGTVGRLSTEFRGFAMSCWKQAHPDALKEGQSILPFMLKMEYKSYEYEVQAAQVVVLRAGRDFVWDADDFFVPPGLWGVGIGENFLRQMRARQTIGAADDAARFERLFVRIRIDPAGGTAAKKSAANEMQLYRSAGFEPIADDGVPDDVKEILHACDREAGRSDAEAARSVTGKTEEWMTSPNADRKRI